MENRPMAFALRPLRIGEMIDRAVTMYVKNIVVFTALVLVVLAPVAVVQAFTAGNQIGQLDASIAVLKHAADPSSPAPTKDVQKIEKLQPGILLAGSIIVLLAMLLSPVGSGAVAVGVARIYRGESASFGPCFLAALRRWPAMVGIAVIGLVIFVLWYLATVILAVILAIPGALLVAKALPVAIVFFVIAGILVLACLLGLVLLFLALAFAFFAVVVENKSVWAAFGSGFSRIFRRTEMGRALLFALAIGGVQIGGSSLAAAVALVMLFVLHSSILYAIVASLINALLSGFLTVFSVLYYFDVRLRTDSLPNAESGVPPAFAT